MEQFEDDGTWVWVAFDPEHKVVLAHDVGERKKPSANKLLKRVKERIAGITSLCSDGLKFYGHVVSFPSKRRKWTPMPELGITDRNWSMKELLTFPYHKTSV